MSFSVLHSHFKNWPFDMYIHNGRLETFKSPIGYTSQPNLTQVIW